MSRGAEPTNPLQMENEQGKTKLGFRRVKVLD